MDFIIIFTHACFSIFQTMEHQGHLVEHRHAWITMDRSASPTQQPLGLLTPTVVSACLRPPHNLWITAHGGVDANPTIAFHHHHRCCSASGALTVPFRLLLLPSASVVCFGLPVVVCLLLPVVGTGESDTVARALHCPACAKNCVVCRKSHTKGRLVHARRPSSNKKGERALLPHDF